MQAMNSMWKVLRELFGEDEGICNESQKRRLLYMIERMKSYPYDRACRKSMYSPLFARVVTFVQFGRQGVVILL